jgi:hypothetical protein
LLPPEAVAEVGGVFGDDAVVGAWGGLAGVDVVEKLLPEVADARPLSDE